MSASLKINRKARGPARGMHHIDQRADQVLAAAPATTSDDDMLSTVELSRWLGVSVQWLEIGRSRGFGPDFVKLGERCIRYRRGTVRHWLVTRASARIAVSVKSREVAR